MAKWKCKGQLWKVVMFKCYRHFFGGGRSKIRPCKSSLLFCVSCHCEWRTTAKYADKLEEIQRENDSNYKKKVKPGWSHLIPNYSNGEADPKENVYVYG